VSRRQNLSNDEAKKLQALLLRKDVATKVKGCSELKQFDAYDLRIPSLDCSSSAVDVVAVK
jgi:hypothetical protein